MDKTITTALLIVVSMIMVVMLFNVAYPAIVQGGDAVTSMANSAADRMKYHLSFVHASAELDDTGWWQDTNGNSMFDVFGWVKNTGTMRVTALDRIDVFFGREGSYTRIPYQAEAGGSYPYWTWQVENDSEWVPTGTVQFAVHYNTPLGVGRYFMKVILPNGVAAEYTLGI